MSWILGGATLLGGMAALVYFIDLYRRRKASALTKGSAAGAKAQLLRQCTDSVARIDDLIALASKEPATNYGHSASLRKAVESLLGNRTDAERLGPDIVTAHFAVRDSWESLPRPRMIRQGDDTHVPQWRAFRSVLMALRDQISRVAAT